MDDMQKKFAEAAREMSEKTRSKNKDSSAEGLVTKRVTKFNNSMKAMQAEWEAKQAGTQEWPFQEPRQPAKKKAAASKSTGKAPTAQVAAAHTNSSQKLKSNNTIDEESGDMKTNIETDVIKKPQPQTDAKLKKIAPIDGDSEDVESDNESSLFIKLKRTTAATHKKAAAVSGKSDDKGKPTGKAFPAKAPAARIDSAQKLQTTNTDEESGDVKSDTDSPLFKKLKRKTAASFKKTAAIDDEIDDMESDDEENDVDAPIAKKIKIDTASKPVKATASKNKSVTTTKKTQVDNMDSDMMKSDYESDIDGPIANKFKIDPAANPKKVAASKTKSMFAATNKALGNDTESDEMESDTDISAIKKTKSNDDAKLKKNAAAKTKAVGPKKIQDAVTKSKANIAKSKFKGAAKKIVVKNETDKIEKKHPVPKIIATKRAAASKNQDAVIKSKQIIVTSKAKAAAKKTVASEDENIEKKPAVSNATGAQKGSEKTAAKRKTDDEENEASVSKKIKTAHNKEVATAKKTPAVEELAADKKAPAAKKASAPKKEKPALIKKEKNKEKAPAKHKKAVEPKPDRFVDPVMKIKIGPKINDAPTNVLDIFVFGENSAGELGLGSKPINGKSPIDVMRPRLNPLLAAETVGVVQLATGGMHCISLTKDNKILTWGVNDEGALGRDCKWEGGMVDADAAARANDNPDVENSDDESDDDFGLKPLESAPGGIDMTNVAPGTKFVKVAACDSASFALTEDGRIYAWGTFRAADGVFGFSKNVRIQHTPVLLPEPTKVVDIATGSNHILTLDSKGKIQTWGSHEQSQLGRRVVLRDALASALRPGGLNFKRGTKITKVATGAYHSFAIDDQGRVWAWGLNNHGQLGFYGESGDDDEETLVLEPTLITELVDEGHRIVGIAGGEHHTLAVTDDGKLVVFGRCDGHQSGLPDDSYTAENSVRDERTGTATILRATVLPLPAPVVAADSGTDSSLALTGGGRVYAWGFNENYQCGLGNTGGDVVTPRLLDSVSVRDKRMVFVGAGGQFGVLACQHEEKEEEKE